MYPFHLPSPILKNTKSLLVVSQRPVQVKDKEIRSVQVNKESGSGISSSTNNGTSIMTRKYMTRKRKSQKVSCSVCIKEWVDMKSYKLLVFIISVISEVTKVYTN